MELDYYQQKLNVRVASQVVEQIKTYDLKKWEHFRKSFKTERSLVPSVSFKNKNLVIGQEY